MNGRGIKRSVGGLLIALFLFSQIAGVSIGYGALPTSSNQKPADAIRSQIEFIPGWGPHIEYADISRWDPIQKCPLETMPVDLAQAVDRLVVKVRDSVSQVKKARGSQCAALDRRMDESRSQLNNALQYHFLATQTVGNAPDPLLERQSAINQSTRQASAVNGLVLTTADLLNRECIESTDARIIVQRMLGQIISLGGLFLGGWQGIGTATGGQLFASLPLFRDDVDRAVHQFQKYDEVNERGSFLCMYRQMQKTSCLMFAEPGTTIIDGLDITLKTGPGQITEESITKIETQSPELLEDSKALWNLESSSRGFVSLFEDHFPNFNEMPVELFHTFIAWCEKQPLADLKSNLHPASTRSSLASLIQACEQISVGTWAIPAREELSQFIYDRYWNIKNLTTYYHSLRSKKDSPLEYVVNTWESHNYFLGVRESMKDFHSPDAGNQARLNFRILTHELGRTLVDDSFRSIFKSNTRDLTGKRTFHPNVNHSREVKRRALEAMLDLCMTLDPTLTCLYPDKNTLSKLQRSWKEQCAGKESRLCKNPVYESLLKEGGKYQIYYESLCNPPSL